MEERRREEKEKNLHLFLYQLASIQRMFNSLCILAARCSVSMTLWRLCALRTTTNAGTDRCAGGLPCSRMHTFCCRWIFVDARRTFESSTSRWAMCHIQFVHNLCTNCRVMDTGGSKYQTQDPAETERERVELLPFQRKRSRALFQSLGKPLALGCSFPRVSRPLGAGGGAARASRDAVVVVVVVGAARAARRVVVVVVVVGAARAAWRGAARHCRAAEHAGARAGRCCVKKQIFSCVLKNPPSGSRTRESADGATHDIASLFAQSVFRELLRASTTRRCRRL